MRYQYINRSNKSDFIRLKCITKRYQFQALGRKEIRAYFDGGTITSDGGGMLLREIGITRIVLVLVRNLHRVFHLEGVLKIKAGQMLEMKR